MQQKANFFYVFLLPFLLSLVSLPSLTTKEVVNQATSICEEAVVTSVLDQLYLCPTCFGSTAKSILVAARKPREMSS